MTCTRSRECQLCPGLRQKQCGQQGEEGVLPIHSCGTLPAVLCPALWPEPQNGHGPVEAGPEESHEGNLRAGTPLL